MTEHTRTTAVGPLPTNTPNDSQVARVTTRLVWLAWVVSLGVLALRLGADEPWTVGPVTVDGLTAVMWVAITFLSGVVHSYARRYMAGDTAFDRFFLSIFGFTAAVSLLVAAANLALFVVTFLAMGLLMARLIGHVDDWPGAQAAARLARRSFLAASGALALAAGLLWAQTGATTIAGVAAALTTATPLVLVAAGLLVLVAMVQSALVPFHTWLLASMTAPTPASALMHAGFVNAGGIVLVRFAPVIGIEPGVMLAIVLVGTASALAGKLLKTVQTDAKGGLAASTVGQMGFMILQVGLGLFAAAITHLVLHGFYKAYQFLATGSQVSRTGPPTETPTHPLGPGGWLVLLGTGIVGGGLFALLTGEGTALGTGLVLALLVTLMTLGATRQLITQPGLSRRVRYAGIPLVALPAIALYAGIYRLVGGLLAGLPGMTIHPELTVVHGLVALAFVGAYLAMETGVYRRSRWLYVTLLNAGQPPRETLAATEGEQ